MSKSRYLYFILVFCFTSAHASTIQVNTTLYGRRNDGLCSLTEAIIAANQDQPVDGCTAGNGEDTILLKAEGYSLSDVDNVTDGPNGLPVIQSSIIIQGIGEHTIRTTIHRKAPTVADPQVPFTDLNTAMRIFRVGNDGKLELRNLSVIGGFLGLKSGIPEIEAGSLDYHGGGILSTGSLSLHHVDIGNTAVGCGGGIYFIGQLKISNSTFRFNKAFESGGAIAGAGTLIMRQSVASGNSAGNNRGFGPSDVNVPASGGAISIQFDPQVPGETVIVNSLFSGNNAKQGGAIAIDSRAKFKLLHTTIDRNAARTVGGGLSILMNEVSSTPQPENNLIANSIIANNSGGDCSLPDSFALAMTGNWVGDSSCDNQALGDPEILDTSLLLSSGIFFSSGSETMIADDSPVIDSADDLICDNALVGNLDLLGGIRKFDGDEINGAQCDIGAIERQPSLFPSFDDNGGFAFLRQFSLDFKWRKYKIEHQKPDQFADLIFSSPPTMHGKQPGVIRLKSVFGCCTEEFFFSAQPVKLVSEWEMRFQEYTYLDQFHLFEQISFLGARPGIAQSDNGETVMVGSFELSGTGQWKTINFPTTSNAPAVFLTAQTANGGQPVNVRIRNVTQQSFEAALFEEEALMQSGHVTERIAYLLIDSSQQSGILDIAGRLLPYQLDQITVDHRWTPVFDVALKLEEEQSADSELWHVKEAVDVLQIDGHIFAQQVSNHGGDTTSLRLR